MTLSSLHKREKTQCVQCLDTHTQIAFVLIELMLIDGSLPHVDIHQLL